MTKGIIFDLDGTLWEVLDATLESANVVAKRHNLPEVSKKTVESCFGLNKEECAKIYFPYLDLITGTKYIEEVVKESTDIINKKGGNIYPDLKETLEFLKENYGLFIVSNTAQNEYIERFMSCSNTTELFKDYIAASLLKISKSDAIKKIIKDNNIDKAIYVGDMIKDLEAADEAKVPFIQAKYGFGDDLKTEFYINEFKELPNEVIKIFK